MNKVNIGVVGLGRMGQVYAAHVAHQIPQARLAAVADPRQDVVQAFTSDFPAVAVYDDYHALLQHPDLHAIIIATPTSTHRDIVIAAAESGKAIFCEKPTALTLSATDEMLEAVYRCHVIFQVGFMRRFDNGYTEAWRKISQDVIGQPVAVRSIGRDPYRTSLEYANPHISGGLIVDMAIHDIDLTRWLMGDEVERVYTETAALVYPELLDVGDVDTAMISLKFAHGGVGNIEVSRTAIYGYDIQTEIIGSKGTLQVGYLRQTPLLVLTREGVQHDVVPHFPQRFGEAYTRQIEHFIDCVVRDAPPIVTPQDARIALQIALAATRSQHEARVVYVSEI